MSINWSNNQILSKKRKGTQNDPFILIEESLPCVNCKTLLTEVPNKFQKVTVSYSEEYSNSKNYKSGDLVYYIINGEKQTCECILDCVNIAPTNTSHWIRVDFIEKQNNELLNKYEYYVDYLSGVVTHHPYFSNHNLIYKYLGEGATFYPASRIWTKANGNEVVETLQGIVDSGQDAIDAVGGLQPKIDEAYALKENLEEDISIGQNLKINLEGNISTGNILNADLQEGIFAANTTDENLQITINNANISKGDLDSSITLSETIKSDLNMVVDDANIINNKLSNPIDGTIKLADDKNISLNVTISDANTVDNNLNATINIADSKNTILNTTINTANATKNDLDDSISIGQATKLDLDNTVVDANTINNILSAPITGTIDIATQKDIDLNATISNADLRNITLNNTINSADTLISDISTAVGTANTAKSELNVTIDDADLKNIELNTTITNANTAKSELETTIIEADLDQYISITQIGKPNGVASLDENGLVHSSQLSIKQALAVVNNIAERDSLADKYEGMKVHVLDASSDITVDSGWAEYLWTGVSWKKVAEKESMDVILDWGNIENKPTKFEPINHTHPGSQVTGLSSVATTGNYNDLINKPFIPTKTSNLTNDSDFTTSASVDDKLANKVDKVIGKQLSTEDYTTIEKNKLAGIENGANKYTHPANHPASIITQDSNNRFVTDTEKSAWNAKETPAGAQAKSDNAENNAKNFASGLVGVLSNLTTTVKTNIVAAVNELRGKQDNLQNTVSTHLADKTAHGNRPYAKLFLVGDQSIPNNVVTKIAFNTIQGDTDLMADTINSKFVIKTAGTYLIQGFVCFALNTVGERGIFLYKNGTLFTGSGLASINGANTIPFVITLPLAVNDTLEIHCRQQSGGSLNILAAGSPAGSRTQMSILRIGD